MRRRDNIVQRREVVKPRASEIYVMGCAGQTRDCDYTGFLPVCYPGDTSVSLRAS